MSRAYLAISLLVLLCRPFGYGQACPFNEATFAAGGTFSGTCTLEVGGSVTLTGVVTWTSGTLTINNGPGASANLFIATGASLNVTGGTVGLTDPSDGGRFEINSGGTLMVGASGTLVTTGTGDNIVFDGGFFESSGTVTLGGDLVLTGGDATIGGGTFTINRSGGDGDIELSGDGTLNITGGTVSVQDDITLTAGSTGYIDINAGAALSTGDDVFILGGSIVVDGTLSAGDRINFGAGSGGSLVGTTPGGVLQFGGVYTPDIECPYSQGSVDFCSCTVSGCLSVLPIVLSEFVATQEADAVRLNWVTQSELNNDFFEVERLNFFNDSFDQIGYLPGNGTSTEVHQYSFFDYAPANGKNYYRLKQTDFDGTTSYSELAAVNFEGEANNLSVHPNPVANGWVQIEGQQGAAHGRAVIEVKNLIGIVITSWEVITDATGAFSYSLDTSGLKQGCYVVTVGGLSTRLFIR